MDIWFRVEGYGGYYVYTRLVWVEVWIAGEHNIQGTPNVHNMSKYDTLHPLDTFGQDWRGYECRVSLVKPRGTGFTYLPFSGC